MYDDPRQLGVALAGEILDRYARTEGAFLLGCPGGRSLRTTYRALAERSGDLSRLVVVMMDEYVGASSDAHYSCAGFARREIAEPLGVDEDRVWLPDPGDPAAYDERIEAAGGIDTFLLASGASDCHVAFLPPGSPLGGKTSVVQLAESTRRDNLVTFPDFRSLDDVPREGVSVGLGTITNARALRLVLHGEDKRTAATRILAHDCFEPGWPATIVHDHGDGEIWIDRAAVP